LRKKLSTFVLLTLTLGVVYGRSAWAGGGTSYFSDSINWQFTGDLYFSVAGAPASVCGDLHSIRNGVTLIANGWICTDASGNATKGPWTWTGTASDQTDTYVTIWWPDGTQTLPFKNHIWDKTCPSTSISWSGVPPTSYSGSATDTAWGAGFNSNWTNVLSYFQDRNTLNYWDPSTGGYTSVVRLPVQGTVSGMPGFSVTWTTPFPSTGAHTSGHVYRWETGVTDGGCRPLGFITFTAP
jgi:hypothetical protein